MHDCLLSNFIAITNKVAFLSDHAMRDAQANQIVPAGFSSVPPVGPAMPLAERAYVAFAAVLRLLPYQRPRFHLPRHRPLIFLVTPHKLRFVIAVINADSNHAELPATSVNAYEIPPPVRFRRGHGVLMFS